MCKIKDEIGRRKEAKLRKTLEVLAEDTKPQLGGKLDAKYSWEKKTGSKK